MEESEKPPNHPEAGMLLGGETASVLLNTPKIFARGCLSPKSCQLSENLCLVG